MAKPPFKLAGEYCDLEAPTSRFVLRDLTYVTIVRRKPYYVLNIDPHYTHKNEVS